MKRLAPAIALAVFVGSLFVLERRRPLRVRVEPGPRRVLRNFAIATTAAAVIAAVERPLVEPIARRVERSGVGLVPALGLPRPAARALSLVLLDYSLFLWHVLLHRVRWLWRTHLPHHVDLDLDASTAFRFHFAEFLASVPWRAAQVAIIGVPPSTLALWQRLAFAEIAFHHSNLRLPRALERALAFLVMTPRLHGIHHATDPRLRDANFSSGLAIWDRLHGTLLGDVAQRSITIGVEPYDRPSQVTLGRSLALPFVPDELRPPQPPCPSGGTPGGCTQLSQVPQRSKPAPSPK